MAEFLNKKITMEKLNRVTDEQSLFNLPITYKGNRYSPITHQECIETIDEYLYKNNFKVQSKEYLSARYGQRMVGKIGVEYPDMELNYLIAYKNSLDGSMSFGAAAGSKVFICSNGSVYGDIFSFKRRHTGSAKQDILIELEHVCNNLEDEMQVQIRRRDRMKEMEISSRTVAELIGRLFIEEQLITSEQLNIIKSELKIPTFDYNAKNSVWELYNHLTFSVRETTPINWHKVHSGVGSFFVNEFKLT